MGSSLFVISGCCAAGQPGGLEYLWIPDLCQICHSLKLPVPWQDANST